MLSVQRYRDISPVTLQLVGGAVSSSLYCGEVEVEGLEGLAESFMVELYRCKVCQFTCGLKASISSHLLARHRPLTYLQEGGAGDGADDREEAGLRRGASPYRDEDEDFLLYNMLDMSPPTCDISSEGGLHVAHTCEVSTLFEEEASMFPLKGGSGLGPGVSSASDPPATQEQMAQSAHLMTLGLCRTSAAKLRPSRPPPEDSPCPPQLSSLKQSEAGTRTGNQSRNRLACPLCPVALPSRRLLGIHVRSHRASGGFSCVCCSRTAGSWEELHPHWSHCRRRRRRKRRKRREQKQEEKVEEEEEEKEEKEEEEEAAASGRFICPVCLRSFRSAASRRTHQHTHHGDQPDGWRSRLIGRAGGKEAELSDSQTSRLPSVPEKKMKTTTRSQEAEKEPAYRCSLCHRKFSTKLTLRRHLGTHGGARPFTCPHCAYCSRLKASLLQHLRTHTGEKPYRCAECPYASIDRSSLLRHSRTHSQEKPYSCQHCDYSSIQKKSLDLHARRHHSGEAFSCQRCDYSSPDRQLLLRHARRHNDDLTEERTL